MAKDPAFLFYSQDFLAGTQFFSDEQVGKYLRLMLAQHITGHLPEKHMLKICGTYDEDIFAKFAKDANGFYYNKRLEDVIDKRKAYSASRSANRAGGKSQAPENEPEDPKNKINISNTYVKHMENENENVNEDKNVTEKIAERAENFKIDCDVYIDEYGEALVNKFVRYWTEASPRAKKMRYEKETVFDIKRRLDTFRDNAVKFDAGKVTGRVSPGAGTASKVSAATDRHAAILEKYKEQ